MGQLLSGVALLVTRACDLQIIQEVYAEMLGKLSLLHDTESLISPLTLAIGHGIHGKPPMDSPCR